MHCWLNIIETNRRLIDHGNYFYLSLGLKCKNSVISPCLSVSQEHLLKACCVGNTLLATINWLIYIFIRMESIVPFSISKTNYLIHGLMESPLQILTMGSQFEFIK